MGGLTGWHRSESMMSSASLSEGTGDLGRDNLGICAFPFGDFDSSVSFVGRVFITGRGLSQPGPCGLNMDPTGDRVLFNILRSDKPVGV